MTAAPLEIGAVACELGIAPSTLRSWERRYRTVVPRRGANGQRLYDSDQVLVLHQILAQTRRGVRARLAHQAAGGTAPLRISRLRLEPTAEGPRIARREVERLLANGAYSDAFAFNVRLVASELVKHAVVHGAAQRIELEIEADPDSVELRVGNLGSRLTLRSLRSRRLETRRGFEIVEALADSWSIAAGPRGTRVSVRLSTGHEADV